MLSYAAVLLSGTMVVGQVEESSQVPDGVAKAIEFSAGAWAVEVTEGDETRKGRANFRPLPGGYCMLATVTVRADNSRASFTFLSGWDASTGGFTDQGIGSEGQTWTTRWTVVSPTVCEGESVGTEGDKKTSSKVRMERKPPDELVVTITDRIEDGEPQPDTTIVYQRQTREKAKRERNQN
jgi:hypothetical protein